MGKKGFAPLVVAAGLLIGCATLPQSSAQTQAQPLPPAPNPTLTMDVSNTKTTMTAAATPCNPGERCRISLNIRLNKRGRCVIKNEDDANVKFSAKGEAIMVWQLNSLDGGDYRFCPAAGDGVYLKDQEDDGTKQMTEMAMAEDQNGTIDSDLKSMKCRPFYRWKNKNDVASSADEDKRFDYQMRFRDMSNPAKPIVCSIDPWIRNG